MGFLPLLRPGSIYRADQGLAMELAFDLLHCPEPLYARHSSLAHHKESWQWNSEVQASVAWGSEVGTADPGNLVHHRVREREQERERGRENGEGEPAKRE